MPSARSHADIMIPAIGTRCSGVRATEMGPVIGDYLLVNNLLTFEGHSGKHSSSERGDKRLAWLWRVFPFFNVRLPKLRTFASGKDGLVVSAVAGNV